MSCFAHDCRAHFYVACRWLYTQFLAVDANFKLKLKDRGFQDIELAPGWAYFVEEESYQDAVNKLRDETEVRVFHDIQSGF